MSNLARPNEKPTQARSVVVMATVRSSMQLSVHPAIFVTASSIIYLSIVKYYEAIEPSVEWWIKEKATWEARVWALW